MKTFRIAKTSALLILGIISSIEGKICQAAGGRDSAGGSGVAYYFPGKPKTIANLARVESTDVYRATHEFATKLDLVFLNAESATNQNQTEMETEDQSNKILDDLLLRVAKKSSIFATHLVSAKPLITRWTPILNEQSLQLNMDYGPPFKLDDPSNMSRVQIIERRTNKLFKDDHYYQKMNAFNRASIKFHELAYAVSGHPTSYFIQMLFAQVVSQSFNNLTEIQFNDLMANRFDLKYQTIANKISLIKLPQGVTVVKYSNYDSTNSIDSYLDYNDSYFGGYSSVYATKGSTCGQISEVDYEKHEIRFHSKNKELFSFRSSDYSDEYDIYSLSPKDWEQFSDARVNIETFLKANNPDYLVPASGFYNNSTTCIYTNPIGAFDGFDYVEFQFGYTRSDSSKLVSATQLDVYQIEIAKKLRVLAVEAALLAKQEPIEIQNVSFHERPSVKNRFASLNSANSLKRLQLELELDDYKLANSLLSVSKDMFDFKTLCTIGLKFSN